MLHISDADASELGLASTFSDRIVACAPHRINPYKVLGIAHRTLHCGTRVIVTNRRNGRSVMARVVDVGPCTSSWCRHTAPARIRHRFIDLLPAVARAIGHNGLETVILRVQ